MPSRLAGELPRHEVRTAPEMGWADLDDGSLLDSMEDRFDVLVTVDKSLPKQQQTGNLHFVSQCTTGYINVDKQVGAM